MSIDENDKPPAAGRADGTAPADDIAGYMPGDETIEEDDRGRGAEIVPRSARTSPSPRSTGTPHAGDADGMVGAEVIQTLVKRLPNAPGVYRMMNAAGDVLYVGKARSLKKRVTNYAQGRFHTNRIGRMVRETVDDGVRRHPHRDRGAAARSQPDQALAAALQRADAGRQVVPLHPADRRPCRRPASSSIAARARARATISGRSPRPARSAAPSIRCSAPSCCSTCTDSVFESRTRPCLLYQIKRCSGPCTGEIARRDYAELVSEAKDFLSGRSQKVKTEISAAMQEASEELDFERAAVYRDRLAALSHVQSHQGINPQGVDEADVFAIHQEGGQTCIQVFFFRTGQNWGNRAYFPKADPALEPARSAGLVPRPVLRRQADARASILLSHAVEEQELLAEALSHPRRPQGDDQRAAARREEGSGRPRAAECPRGARAPAGRNLDAGAAARRLRRDLRAGQARRGASRSTTTRTSWAPTPSAR